MGRDYSNDLPTWTACKQCNAKGGSQRSILHLETCPIYKAQDEVKSTERELLEAVERWETHPAPVNATLVLKVAERWAKAKIAAGES